MMIKLTDSDYNKGTSLEINVFGDSLTQGAGATDNLSYPSQLANMLFPRLVVNHGIGGQTMEQIACRQGAKPLYITLTGNAFNGTNAVALTNISTEFLSTPSFSTDQYASGVVNGVPAVIRRYVVTGVETYSITPGSSSTETILPNSLFYPDTAFNSASGIQIHWWGRNNVPNLAGLEELLNKAIAVMKRPRRFLLVGVLNALDENTTSKTASHEAILSINNTLRTNYPKNFIEAIPPTNVEMEELLYTPTAQDNTDIANGTIPTGMRADNIHLNNIGYALLANRIFKKMNEYQWT